VNGFTARVGHLAEGRPTRLIVLGEATVKTTLVVLAIALAGAVAGGIVGPQQAEAYCPIDEPCPEGAWTKSSGVEAILQEWELSAQRVAYQMEQGVLQMARAPRF
jgi:hypothetical protein